MDNVEKTLKEISQFIREHQHQLEPHDLLTALILFRGFSNSASAAQQLVKSLAERLEGDLITGWEK